jgi:hypothetical protein
MLQVPLKTENVRYFSFVPKIHKKMNDYSPVVRVNLWFLVLILADQAEAAGSYVNFNSILDSILYLFILYSSCVYLYGDA